MATFAKELAQFPPALRELIDAEVAAGNEIVEISSTFPAPPAGAYVMLAKPVTTRPRASSAGVSFYNRNSSSYSGEFADERRFYFVLEPPLPPEPYPDMDAIRAAIDAKQRAADADLYAAAAHRETSDSRTVVPSPALQAGQGSHPRELTAVDRFRESMVGTYERWREGIGYDTAIFQTATPDELVEIETLLLSREIDDWRDVEALAALDSPRARAALHRALKSANHRVQIAVADYAPHLISEEQRTAVLVKALEGSDTYGGLTQALLQVQSFHPPAVIDALLRGVLARRDGPPVHFAAMLMFLHGKAPTAFDWDQRPFFLQFNTDDRQERRRLFQDLCARIGVDPMKYLDAET